MLQEKTAPTQSPAVNLLLDNPYQRLQCHQQDALFEQCWKPESRHLDTGQFREQIWATLACLRKSRPRGILIDNTDFAFVMVPEEQDWFNQLVTPMLTASVLRVAVLPSVDVFARVALQQLIDDNPALRAITVEHPDRDSAFAWLRAR